MFTHWVQGQSFLTVEICALDGTMTLIIQRQRVVSSLEDRRVMLTQVMITNGSFSPDRAPDISPTKNRGVIIHIYAAFPNLS